jgi:hypothetical protein
MILLLAPLGRPMRREGNAALHPCRSQTDVGLRLTFAGRRATSENKLSRSPTGAQHDLPQWLVGLTLAIQTQIDDLGLHTYNTEYGTKKPGN